MAIATEILDKKIKETAKRIKNTCQQFYRGRLEVAVPLPDDDPEYYVYFEEAGYPGRRIQNFLAEIYLLEVDIFRKKICSISRDIGWGGIRRAWVFDERVISIIEKELATLKRELPGFEIQIEQEYVDFSEY